MKADLTDGYELFFASTLPGVTIAPALAALFKGWGWGWGWSGPRRPEIHWLVIGTVVLVLLPTWRFLTAGQRKKSAPPGGEGGAPTSVTWCTSSGPSRWAGPFLAQESFPMIDAAKGFQKKSSCGGARLAKAVRVRQPGRTSLRTDRTTGTRPKQPDPGILRKRWYPDSDRPCVRSGPTGSPP